MICLIIGGAASGKSEMAERICTKLGQRVAYVATMQPFGTDAQKRIARHLKLREGKGFLTVEQYTHIQSVWEQLGEEADTLLIECMSNLCANELFDDNGVKENAAEVIVEGVRELASHYANIVLVTNEVFSDGVQYDNTTMTYIAQLGLLNQKLAQLSDGVVEVFYGIPMIHRDSCSQLKELLEK